LMRYHHHAPTDVMEGLIVFLLNWAKAQDYQWFSLGMARVPGADSGWPAFWPTSRRSLPAPIEEFF